MSDLPEYAAARAARDSEFAADLESGYTDFKVGALLRQAREKTGLTQLTTRRDALAQHLEPPTEEWSGRS